MINKDLIKNALMTQINGLRFQLEREINPIVTKKLGNETYPFSPFQIWKSTVNIDESKGLAIEDLVEYYAEYLNKRAKEIRNYQIEITGLRYLKEVIDTPPNNNDPPK